MFRKFGSYSLRLFHTWIRLLGEVRWDAIARIVELNNYFILMDWNWIVVWTNKCMVDYTVNESFVKEFTIYQMYLQLDDGFLLWHVKSIYEHRTHKHVQFSQWMNLLLTNTWRHQIGWKSFKLEKQLFQFLNENFRFLNVVNLNRS